MSNAIQTIQSDIIGCELGFNQVLSDKSINFHREAEFAIQVLSGNDYALKIAMANRQSVTNAITNLAAIGLSLNPAKRQCYLVPRDNKICLDISYMGLAELAIASGSVSWVKAELVREADTFELNGMGHLPSHKFNPFSKDRGAIIGVYSVAKVANGDHLVDTMSIDEVNDIRDRSSAWKAWISKQKRCPWVTDEGEMVKKTIIKRASKMWPKTDRLDSAIHYLNNEAGEGLESIKPQDIPMVDEVKQGLPAMPPGHMDKRIAGWADQILTGGKTTQELIDFLSTRYTLSAYDVERIKGIPQEFIQGEAA